MHPFIKPHHSTNLSFYTLIKSPSYRRAGILTAGRHPIVGMTFLLIHHHIIHSTSQNIRENHKHPRHPRSPNLQPPTSNVPTLNPKPNLLPTFNPNKIDMIITVFGATGQVGKRIVKYALAKGHTVRAFGRNVTDLIDEDNRSESLEAIKGSVFDDGEVFNAVKGVDAVLSALGGSTDGEDKTRSIGMRKIVAQMQKAGVHKIVVVGGLGIAAADNEMFMMDTPDFPKEYMAVSREHMQAFLQLQHSTLSWTFVCCPSIKEEDGTGQYKVTDTYLPDPNLFYIASGDLAHFMVNESEHPKHDKQRVGISASA